MFSILIANYNNGKYFKDCWESILCQTFQDFEVIIVDDASTDNSVRTIEQIIKNDNRAKLYINDKNYGCGYTKRKCVELANGEICGFLDPDDVIKEEALEIMVKEHILNQDASIISSKVILVDEQLNYIEHLQQGQSIPEDKSYLTFGMFAIVPFASFKRSHYNKTLGIDPKFIRAVDQDLYLKLEEVGKHIYIDKYLYLYRKITNSVSSSKTASYWIAIAKYDAFLRRRVNNLPINNYKSNHIKSILCNEYLVLANDAVFLRRQCAKFYFLFKATKLLPLHGMKTKLKLLIKF